MRQRTLLLFLLCGVVFLSCNRNTVTLSFTNARGEVPRLGNLSFRFSKSLYPDSLLDRWDSTDYISFEPRIPGRFRWKGPEELVFSPSASLAPATTYKARLNKALLHYSAASGLEAEPVTFHTAPLQLLDAQVTWVERADGGRSAVPQINLQFNYPVKTEELQKNLTLQVEGKKADYALQSTGVSQSVTLQLLGFRLEDRSYAAAVLLGKGLRPVNGSDATQEDTRLSLSLPSPYVLSIGNVESEHDGTQGVVRIYTSQPVEAANIASFIRFRPSVPYTVEHTDYGLVLRSEKFESDNSYALTIAGDLRGRIGGVLKEPYSGGVAFGELESDIRFTNSKAVYLSKHGGGNLEVRITNTPKIKLVISRIYENNLLMAERSGYDPGDEGDGEYASYGEDGERRDYVPVSAGDVVYSKEIDTRSLPRSGTGRLLNLAQFEDRLPDAKGIYHVQVRSAQNYWVRDSRFISFSDIGLIARQGKDKLLVFANSIKTALPLGGVNVLVYGGNNQLLGTGATNADGVAEVQVTSRPFAGYRPAMVIAKTADDFTYLPFNSTGVNLSRFEVGGKRTNATGLDAFIYAERDIYRPGEKLNFAVLLREAGWKSPGELPLKIKFLLPNGKELKTFRKSLNEQGATEGGIELSPSAITGTYSLEVYSSNEVLLASRAFMVEEFVPDRIKVTARLDKPFLRPAESASLQVTAVNFFGPPAASRKYETEIQVKQKSFTAKKYPGYNFGLDNLSGFFDKDVREGTTDANGAASLGYTVPEMYRNSGLLQAAFYTTVFDETGRPVSRHTVTDIFTQEVYHGIRNDGYGYYALNQPVHFDVVALNRAGEPVSATARMQVIKHEYHTVLTRSGSLFRYESQREDKVVSDGEKAINGQGNIVYIPRSPGDYELRVYRPGANAYVSRHFYSYGSWGGDNSFEVNTEGNIDISLEKAAYNTGDRARVLFKTPFSGRMLVTVESDRVLSYQYLQVDKRTASLELPVSTAYLPNVYITATLIKPHEASDLPLTVAHGFQLLKVEERDRRIPVEIMAPAKVRSSTRQTVRVKASPGAYVSLAAVDNGILQISDFATPDPYQYFYQRTALQVSPFDLYPLLFPEVRGRLSSTGGDGDLKLDKRVNPMPAKRFKLLSYWSGLKKADGSGVAEFQYDIPAFSGQVRLMAVAFRDERFGSAEATTTVADPVVVSTALPRFVSPGDTVLVPVTVTNTTARPAAGTASLQVQGPLRLLGAAGQPVSIAPNSEARVEYRLLAGSDIGVGKVRFSLSALGENFKEEVAISVRPASTLQQLAGAGTINGGSTQRLSIPQKDFLPGSFRYSLVVSRSPVAQLADQLRYLVQYPFGCTEQTVSAAFPQLYFGDFADLLNKGADSKQNASANVQEAIRRIKMRQLYSGALTLWDGEGKEDWWTTVYAAHFLLEARKAGFDVDNSLLETMLGYLVNRLKNRELVSYYYNRNQQKKIAPKEVAYSLYVLSLAGRAQASALNYYKAHTPQLALDSRYLLAAAFAVSGDRRSFLSLLPSSFSGEESVQQTGGSYYSALRDEAIALNALLDTDPGNPQVGVMARHVAERLKTERYLNTQERSFGFLALGKQARMAARSTVTAELRGNGRTLAQIGGDWKGSSEGLKTTELEFVAKGEGRMYYSWVAEGISRSGAYVEEDQFIRIRRRFFDRYGQPVTGNTFRQNALIIVELTLEKAYDNDVANIVITDLLPAGFEIENSRTKDLPGMDWIKNASEPTAMDVRDDRIHFFVDALRPKQRYYYAVRAVSPGQFKQGPVSADAMYAGEIHSYHGAQTIRVIR